MKDFGIAILVILFINTFSINAQSLPAFQEFDQALIKKDTAKLNQLTHPQLTMGHSNGWLQDKDDLLHSVIDGYVDYTVIDQIETPTIFLQTDSLMVTRRNIDVEGIVNKYKFDVKLNVLENWVFIKNKWILISRQSVNRKTE